MGKLNSRLKLNNIFKEGEINKKPIRDGYGEGLLEAGNKNNDVVALTADLTESTRVSDFAEKYPDRFIQIGVAEQNLATVAAGLGVSGKVPFISSFSCFSPGRNWEQIRTTIAYNDSNVKISGHHAGISTGPDGATHQSIEDIATMRSMPNMKVFVPCDAEEARKVTVFAADNWGPVYIRLGRPGVPIITTKETPFKPDRAEEFWISRSPDVVIISCGTMTYDSLFAAKQLEDKDNIKVTVMNVCSIKPLDTKNILRVASKAGAVVTAEDHNVLGGLGGAIAELLAKEHPLPIEFVGVEDKFGESGDIEDLKDKYGLTSKNIIKATKKVIKRK